VDDSRVTLGFRFTEQDRRQRGGIEDHFGSPRSS
jgi:hypothetical protein